MNNDYILPYIPDKKLYAAVMGACSWIKNDGRCFHIAINYYAQKYNVSADEITKYVRMAQGNAHKKANAKRPPNKILLVCCRV